MTKTNSNPEYIDPLANPGFRPPGLLEKLHDALLGPSRPLDCLQIEVTSFCAGKCIYCPHTTQASAWNSRHISVEAFAALWPILRIAKRAHLQGWGEPLLHPRFLDMAALALKAGCQVSSTSCGLKMDMELARKLAGSGMDILAFSLVGTDAASNDARQGIPFERVRESVRLMRCAIAEAQSPEPLEIHLAYLLLADRLDALRRLPELMDEWGVQAAVISTLDYLAIPEQERLAFTPDDHQSLAYAHKLLEEIALDAQSRGRTIHFALPDNKARIANGCRENITRSLYIDADGDVSPCVYLNVPGSDPKERRRIFGNVLAQNPLDIWRKADFKKFRDSLKAGYAELPCLNCPKRFESHN